MAAILNGSDDEVLIIKSLTHRDFNAITKELPNPVYLFQGIVLRRGAKGTIMKFIELALSMCDIVDIYGFTMDPSLHGMDTLLLSPRTGYNPLQGWAYYQLLECLGVIRIHSPMRSKRKQDLSIMPSKEIIRDAYATALHLKKSLFGSENKLGLFVSCKEWGTTGINSDLMVSGSPDMSDRRKKSPVQ